MLVSGFVALTLTPMMCSVLLRHQSSHSRWYNLIEGWLVALGNGYSRLLRGALRHRALVVTVGLLVALASGVLFKIVKSELAPIEDRGVVFGIVMALASCHFGLAVQGGAPGVGRAVNSTVVASAAGIFVLDYFVSFGF